ncbi:uncharacterized protein N7473_008970 [Penicillium subrubescens]|uniref:uncharacterized protein n=1 Tax=Penicillium subrubescens TaxID=1316194 RepID=UPI002545AA5E|nr:uncharacterized protein N7473_008970 [Penicillium subrubescens]KAJ5886296.1 hypothetical protein N7473_008970 [Penicillium subrubescens]
MGNAEISANNPSHTQSDHTKNHHRALKKSFTFLALLTYEGASKSQSPPVARSLPSRAVAIQKYPKQYTRRRISRFGRLEHRNMLSLRECYLDGNVFFSMIDDLPLTLGHVRFLSNNTSAESELGCVMVL